MGTVTKSHRSRKVSTWNPKCFRHHVYDSCRSDVESKVKVQVGVSEGKTGRMWGKGKKAE
jgi:hypothetical protein